VQQAYTIETRFDSMLVARAQVEGVALRRPPGLLARYDVARIEASLGA
jgi:hypothetical protein